jgi:hypothetical protein
MKWVVALAEAPEVPEDPVQHQQDPQTPLAVEILPVSVLVSKVNLV